MYRYSADEEKVVPQKLKKSAKQLETKTSKEVVHVKERYFPFEQLLRLISLSVLLSLRFLRSTVEAKYIICLEFCSEKLFFPSIS